jgi:hypothetical protein
MDLPLDYPHDFIGGRIAAGLNMPTTQREPDGIFVAFLPAIAVPSL